MHHPFEVWVEIWKITCSTWRKYWTAEAIEFMNTTFEFGSAQPSVLHAWLNREYGCGPALIQTSNLKWAEQNALNFYNAVYWNACFSLWILFGWSKDRRLDQFRWPWFGPCDRSTASYPGLTGSAFLLLGTLRSNDADGNENVKKTNRFY